MTRFVVIALLVLMSGNAFSQPVRFPGAAVGNVPAGPDIPAQLYLPEGSGPFPTIVLVHSCAGVTDHLENWAKLLTGWGYLVLAPDSFGPRGMKQVCTNGAVTASERLPDIAGAIRFLAGRADVKADRIGLIGQSHGASTVVRAVQKANDLGVLGLRAAVAYYPSCSDKSDRGVDVPLLILIGDKDDWTPASKCRRLEAAGFAHPDLVEIVYYPDAYHAFAADRPDRTAQGRNGQVHHLSYDAAAAADAERRTRSFFERHLH